jgi:hypothetical protein
VNLADQVPAEFIARCRALRHWDRQYSPVS